MKQMKTIHRLLALTLVLALALSLTACGKTETTKTPDAAETAKGIYDCMMKEDSAYSEVKGYYDYLPEVQFTETLDGSKITVSASGSEYAEGTWEYVVDGEYLTTTGSTGNYLGYTLASAMAGVVGDYLGMDPELLQGYLRGISVLNIQSDDLILDTDEAAGTYSFRYRITGPYEMKELEQMVVDERLLANYEPLGEDYKTVSFSVGKLLLICEGSADDCRFLLRESGALDEVALTSLRNVVSYLKPAGYESFAENYTALAEAQTDEYTVTFNVDEEALAEYGLEQDDAHQFALIHFGG